ncbi:MAG: hypothetical protein ABF245_09340, partial [Planktotalea arctica]
IQRCSLWIHVDRLAVERFQAMVLVAVIATATVLGLSIDFDPGHGAADVMSCELAFVCIETKAGDFAYLEFFARLCR